MLDTIKQEFRLKWFKILCLLVVCVYLYYTIDHVRDWLSKSQQPQVLVTTPQQQFIDPRGNITVNAPPVYVSIPETTKEQTTVGVVEKSDKSRADVVLDESKTKYTFEYKNGLGTKTFEVVPDIQENYKFEKGQMYIDRTITHKTSVSVPTPTGGFGIGMSLDKKPVVGAATRLGRTSANAQVITDGSKEGTYFLLMNTNYK